MHSKNKLFCIIILLITLSLCIGAISATDNSSVVSNDSSINHNSSIVNNSIVSDSSIYNTTSSKDKQLLKSADVNVYTNDNSNSGSFTDLNNKILNGGNYISLNQNYTYNPTTDSSFKNGVTISKSITINGNGYTINGLNIAEAFNIRSSGVTIANCSIINTNSTTSGGAIYSFNSNNVLIYNCTFINSTGSNGGAIFLFKGKNCSIDYCKFINTSSNSGGALYWYGASGTISNCKFINTISEDGGAIFWNDGNNTKILNCNFTNTHSNKFGGAILLFGLTSMSNCYIINSSFVNTSSDDQGGALYWYGPNATLENCRFINDTSLDKGGAISCIICDNGIINNCIITNCSAIEGSALYQENNYLVINNSIILDNRANSTALNISNSGTNVIISFNGLNNIFNAISINGTVNATNLTYWGVNGVTNTGNVSKLFKPNDFTPEGIGFKVTVSDMENKVLLSKVYYTDDDGKILVDLSDLPNTRFYKINTEITNETYYTRISGNGTFDLRRNVTKTIIKDIIYGNQVITIIFDDNVTGNVSITIGNSEYTGIITNGVSNINIGIKDAGKYLTKVSYSGDDNYLNFTNKEVNFTINKTSPILIINADNVTYGNNVTINVNLTGVDGVGLNDTVNLTVNGTKYTVNVVDGVGSQLILMPGIGVYNVTASYDSTNNYNATNNTTSFVVSKAVPVLVIGAGDVTYGNDVIVHIKLSGVDGAGLNGTVDLVVNGTRYAVSVVDGVGTQVVSGLGAGSYDVTVGYDGCENYTAVSGFASFVVGKANVTSFDVTVMNTTFNADNSVGFNVVGVNGELLNGTVDVTVNGRVYSVAVVGGKGVLVLKDLVPGSYGVVAVFQGTGNYNASTRSDSFVVSKAVPVLVIGAGDVTYGDSVVVSVGLTGVDGAGLNGTVDLVVNGTRYAVSVVDGVGTQVVSGLGAGSYDVTVGYDGCENYTAVSGFASFVVGKANVTSFDVTVMNTTFNADNSVGFNVVGVNGELLNGTVDVTVNGRVYSVAVVGGKCVLVLKDLVPGSYGVVAVFQGTGNYNASTRSDSFVVSKAVPVLVIGAGDVTYGDSVVVSVGLTGVDGAGLNGTVEINLDNFEVLKSKGLLGSNIIKVEVTNGKGVYIFTHPNAGIYNISANYAGNENYTNVNNKTSFKVSKANLTVFNVTVNNSTYGETNIVNVTAIGVNNELINGIAEVTVNGKSYNFTVKDGKSTLSIDDLSAGKYNVKISFGDNNYNNITNETSFIVNKSPTNLNVSLVNTTFNGNNHTARFNVTLNGSNGMLLNETVNVTVNNKTYSVNIINGTGVLDVDGLNAGNYTVESVFGGNDNFDPSNSTINFTINSLKPDLTIKVVTNKNNATIYVTLSYNGTGLNGTVIVTVNNKHYIVNVIDGKGNLTLTNLKNGKYIVTAIFNGDNIYLNAYANATFNINVPSNSNKSDNNKSIIPSGNNGNDSYNNQSITTDNVNNMPKTGNPIALLFAVLCILGLMYNRKH